MALAGPVEPEIGRWMLDRLVAGAVRYGHPFAILMMRARAPQHLAPLAEIAAGALRGADVLVRWDDRRLLALLPDTDRSGLFRAAERLRTAAGDLPLALGGASWSGDTATDLLDRAERALATQPAV
jgi:GGDEF domain-containing protein